MNAKIQELTKKVYNEGIQKANKEAEEIIALAEAKAKEIEAKAKANAEEMLKSAEKKASELQKNTESELKLYASQLSSSIQSELTDKLTGKIASDNVKAAMTDPAFMQAVILEMVKGFDLNKGVVLESTQAEALTKYFEANAKAILEQGLEIKSVAGKATDIVIRPKDGAFKIQVGEAEFEELFKSFLRPQMVKMLF